MHWIIPDWPAPKNVHAFITTRSGGVSSGEYSSLNIGMHVGDNLPAVSENRRRIQESLPELPVYLRQVHGTAVCNAKAKIESEPEADASITSALQTVLVVQTADCLPVLLCDRHGTAVGAVHAGWRGLCNGVIENTVKAMNIAGSDLLAYLGPAIGPDRFEVGEEVRSAFSVQHADAAMHFKALSDKKWLADIYALAKQRLIALGVTHIYGGNFCTFSESERFFSYRREGITGRMGAFIWLDKGAT